MLAVLGAKLGPEHAVRVAALEGTLSGEGVPRVVIWNQNRSLDSGEATSTAVREESPGAQAFETLPLPVLHPEFYSVMEEIGESCCFGQLC